MLAADVLGDVRMFSSPEPTVAREPVPVQPVEGPPPPHRWAERDPVAAARLARCRAELAQVRAQADTQPHLAAARQCIDQLLEQEER